jgi:hypothetical protein
LLEISIHIAANLQNLGNLTGRISFIYFWFEWVFHEAAFLVSKQSGEGTRPQNYLQQSRST